MKVGQDDTDMGALYNSLAMLEYQQNLTTRNNRYRKIQILGDTQRRVNGRAYQKN